MKLKDIVTLLNAKVCVGENRLEEEVETVCASDLMSEVLTLKDTPLLVTGLCNTQTIRTCDMACIENLLIVRNKKPTEEMIELAQENDMTVLTCESSLFKVCGLLYQAGMKPLF